MSKLVQILVGGVDVTSATRGYTVEKVFTGDVSKAEIKFGTSLFTLLTAGGKTLKQFLSVEIWEGRVTATEKRVLKGIIVKTKENIARISVVAFSDKYKAVLASLTKHYKITGSEGGQHSEIFKDLMDNANLSYNSSSVQSSSTSELLTDFFVKGTDIAERAQEVTDRINYQWWYDDHADLNYFEPRGFTTNSNIIYIGGANNNVVNVPDWVDDGTTVYNEVIVKGAFDRVVEYQTENGDGSTAQFTLNHIPDGLEIIVDGTAQTIGKTGVVESVNALLDAPNKRVTFQSGSIPATGTNNIEFYITRLIETPVTMRDETSIADNENVVSSTTITLSDVSTVADAEIVGKKFLERRKNQFNKTTLRIKPSVIESLGLEVGQSVSVVDSINNNRSSNYVITKMKIKYPETNIEVTIANEQYLEPDPEYDKLMRLKRLEEKFESTDIFLNILRLLRNSVSVTNTLSTLQENINDSFTLDHSINGLMDQGQILDILNTSVSNWSSTDFTLSDNSDTDFVQVQTGSLKGVWSASGSGTISSTQSLGDLSTETGVSSGTPSQGTVGVWLYVTDSADVTSMSLKIGSSASDYSQISALEYGSSTTFGDETFTLRDGWNYLVFRFNNGTITGTPDWTAVDYVEFTLNRGVSSGTLYLDYFTISKNNNIGLNGLGRRYTTYASTTS